MTALKKLSLFAVLTVMALLPVGVANAQENLVTCTATAVKPLIRIEGIAELVGDIVLTCESSLTDPEDDEFEVNVDLFTSVFITNNRSFGAETDITDAPIIINENNSPAPVSGGNDHSCASQTNTTSGTGVLNQCPQRGLLASNNNITLERRYVSRSRRFQRR